jgi:cytochrome c6
VRTDLLIFLALTGVPAMGQQKPPASGQTIYKSKCERCHGADGSKQAMGAKNLQATFMSDTDLKKLIGDGYRKMPAFRKKVSPLEMDLLIEYVKGLRKS